MGEPARASRNSSSESESSCQEGQGSSVQFSQTVPLDQNPGLTHRVRNLWRDVGRLKDVGTRILRANARFSQTAKPGDEERVHS